MGNNLHILHLEPYDDSVSVRDRLAGIDARFVLLVWPDGGAVLRRKIDLLLVQRQAARLAQRIALVTSDPAVIDHAGDLNISVFPSEQVARRRPWKRPRDTAFTPGCDPDAQADLVDHVVRMRGRALARARQPWRRALRWLMFVALLAALVLAFFLVAPSATVTITPASAQVFVRVPILADPALTDIDIENYRMPAAVIPLESTARVTVQSSGRESAGVARSQGLVSFTNQEDVPVVVPLGTIVTTNDTYPVRFETLIETTLPAGPDAAIQVPIQAVVENAGAVGNVNPGAITRIEGSLASRISVTNPNVTYGGSVQERATVTADDHERLRVLARQQVLQHARDLLLHQLTGEQFLVPGSLIITQERPEWFVYSAFVGDSAESVTLDMRARVQAVIVDERVARQVAYSGLASYVQPGLEISPRALTFTRGDIQQIEPDGRVSFLMIVEGSIAVSVDANAVRDRVAGVSVGEAQRRLQRELVLDPARPPQITTWPGWFGRLPVLPVRITVRIEAP